MYRPRKTIDLLDEEKNPQTQSRPSRVSRLPQQPNRQMARSRSMSNATRQSTAGHHPPDNGASATKHQARPSRGVCATPLRTPQTQTRSRSSSAAIGTAEKDRRNLQDQAAVVLEKLNAHPEFGSELLPTGLKPITTKQFIATVSFFMKTVIGNARGNRIVNVTTEDIGQWLTQIHYPHMQSRSWLKTPNVPHAFSHLVELMVWLSHFIPDDPADPMPSARKPEFYINDHQSSEFFEVIRDTFILWNNNQHEDTQRKNQDSLVDKYILQRTGIAGAKEVIKETKKIKAEITSLKRDGPVLCPKQSAQLEQQQVKQKLLKQEQQRYMSELHDKQLTLQRLKSELKVNEKQTSQSEAIHSQLKDKIKRQPMTKSEFHQLLEEVARKKDSIKAKQDSIAHLKEIEYKKQLDFSRRLKQQSDLITQLNKFIDQVAEVLSISNYPRICVDPHITVFDIEANVPHIVQQLESAIDANRCTVDELTVEESECNSELAQVNAAIRMLQTDLAEMTKGCAALQERSAAMTAQVGLSATERKWCLDKKLKQLEDCQKEIVQQHDRLKAVRARGRELVAENERLMQNTESEAMTLIAAKEKRIDAECAAVAQLKLVCADVLKQREPEQSEKSSVLTDAESVDAGNDGEKSVVILTETINSPSENVKEANSAVIAI